MSYSIIVQVQIDFIPEHTIQVILKYDVSELTGTISSFVLNSNVKGKTNILKVY